jgi:hypothetical protein
MTRPASLTGQGGRLRKAWRVRIKGYDSAETIFAPTAGKARVMAWRMVDNGDIRIVDVVARRQPDYDVHLPVRDPIADVMSDDERDRLLHAFGADCGDPTKAGYRDYFYTHRDDPPLVSLTERGLMKPMPGDKWGENMTYFVLTTTGKRVALSLVPEYAP